MQEQSRRIRGREQSVGPSGGKRKWTDSEPSESQSSWSACTWSCMPYASAADLETTLYRPKPRAANASTGIQTSRRRMFTLTGVAKCSHRRRITRPRIQRIANPKP
eukprot:7293243-Pyramimonas_sp.AAC.1